MLSPRTDIVPALQGRSQGRNPGAGFRRIAAIPSARSMSLEPMTNGSLFEISNLRTKIATHCYLRAFESSVLRKQELRVPIFIKKDALNLLGLASEMLMN